MTTIENPALKAFVAQMGEELMLAQVLIRRKDAGYELRHGNDRETPVESLRLVTSNEARQLAQYTADKEFRPLKSSPNLQRGWRIVAANDEELESALNQLYPGALADWKAAQMPDPPVTHYREYTNRQTGMYRITTMLTDIQVAGVVSETCDGKHCLKRRLWTVEDLRTDDAGHKSLIPCLEPCAVLMESSRKTVRELQKESAGETHPQPLQGGEQAVGNHGAN